MAASFDTLWPAYEVKMKGDGCNEAAINAFKYNFKVLCSGESTMMPEASLDPVAPLPKYEDLDVALEPELLQKTLILKLNGGLGTGMGLEKAKSLLPVIEGNSFLDLIAKQAAFMKKKYSQPDLKFMLMNSFSTEADTQDAFKAYPELGTGADLSFVQNKAPKVTKDGYAPASWAASPENEWCPPGHGDLYPAMLGSGALDKLLSKGLKYMFVSNSDNLGATMDLKLLSYFKSTGAPFMMEVADRTDADRKAATSPPRRPTVASLCASLRSALQRTRRLSRTLRSTPTSTPTTCGWTWNSSRPSSRRPAARFRCL
jgi:hypothetical protein